MASPTETQPFPDFVEDPEKTTGFKLQLDQAARDAEAAQKKPATKSNAQPPPIVEKVSQYVPVVGKLLGNKDEGKLPKKPQPAPDQIPGPPDRPKHDAQIEDFVRDQHRSKPEDTLEAGME